MEKKGRKEELEVKDQNIRFLHVETCYGGRGR